LGDSVSTSDLGGHGIELRVRPEGSDAPRLLTALGVGVSQALPVVVLGLVSEPGDLIVIEQPELHLHPLMQANLGKLFWRLASTGRRILIETHSEHVLNRLRALIAESRDDASSLVQPIFAEQSMGISNYRLPSIDQFGLLSQDWPEGFLNVISDESRRILRAAVSKRESDVSPTEQKLSENI
jgi:predicted ATPase